MCSVAKMETLSLKCACGYIKHDVIHLGVWQNQPQKLLKFCGGLFSVDRAQDVVRCTKCPSTTTTIEFHCSFCDRVTIMPVKYRVAAGAGNVTTMQMSVHNTVVFSLKL